MTSMTAEASFGVEEHHLQALLGEGLRRARRQRRPVLVSIVRRVPWSDPLEFFERGAVVADDRLFWSCPSEGYAMAGVGAAWTLSVKGTRRFADAATAWRDCCIDALIDGEANIVGTGPVLMGGFAFDPLRRSTALWAGYPDGLLILPQYVLTTVDGVAWLTVNALLSPDRELAAEVQAITGVRGWGMGNGAPAPHPQPPTADSLCVEDVLPATEWEAIVRTLVEDLRCGDLEKVVLARECRVSGRHPFAPSRVLSRLRADYPGCFVFAVARGSRCFLGASPERLARLRHGTVWATCLAGSIARGATAEEDRRLGEALLTSAKDQAEHAVVVRALRDALAGACTELAVASEPTLLKLHNVQHLFTRSSAALPMSARFSISSSAFIRRQRSAATRVRPPCD
ncbi:MAG: chorismate-binding protein [Actinobacteria bacterium]|nr:chorismate-binding protein [Actinomycetota bacterium]